MKTKGLSSYWKIYKDKITKELLFLSATSPESQKPDKEFTKRYEQVGAMRDREDVVSFLEYKGMDLPTDSIAFLKCEHDVKECLGNGANYNQELLGKLVDDIKESTGRVCFGSCRSYDREKACETCYFGKHHTWLLCATVKSLRSWEETQERLSQIAQPPRS